MAQNVAAPVAIAETALGGHVLIFAWMELGTANQSQIQVRGCRTTSLRVVESMIVTGGKALIEINIAGIGGKRGLVERDGDKAQVINRAKRAPDKTIGVACS